MNTTRAAFLYGCIGLALCLVAGCRPSPASLTIPQPDPVIERASPSPTAPPTLAPSATPSPIPPTPTITASPTPEPFIVCSPLEPHPLAELREIISDPYHPPPAGREERHHGVDFSYYRRGERESIAGVGVQAVLDGHVAMTLTDSFPYGNVVIIETPAQDLPDELRQGLGMPDGQSLYILYAHMQAAPLVSLDDPVAACQALGQVGKSGNAGIAHLHIETRTGPPGARFSEMGFYLASHTQAERDNYLRWRVGGEFNHFDPMILLVSTGQ